MRAHRSHGFVLICRRWAAMRLNHSSGWATSFVVVVVVVEEREESLGDVYEFM